MDALLYIQNFQWGLLLAFALGFFTLWFIMDLNQLASLEHKLISRLRNVKKLISLYRKLLHKTNKSFPRDANKRFLNWMDKLKENQRETVRLHSFQIK